jgi:hypothetical protein
MNEVKVWAQMFFEDGSITQGIRFPAEWLDEGFGENISKIATTLLEEGFGVRLFGLETLDCFAP